MESNWALSEWKPTIAVEDGDDVIRRYIDGYTNYSRPRRNERNHLISNVKVTTHGLACSPYSPGLWLTRGKILMKLQYPELAAGDAYKASLLIKHFRDGEPNITPHVTDEIARDLNLTWIMASDIPRLDALTSYGAEILKLSQQLERSASILLAQALLCVHSFEEASTAISGITLQGEQDALLSTLRTAIDNAEAGQARSMRAEGLTMVEIEQEVKNGKIHVQRYPWMSLGFSKRSRQTIREANNSVEKTSGATCHVAHSNIRDDDKEKDVFGMFATVRLPESVHFLKDITIWAAVETSTKSCATCCKIMPSATMWTMCCGLELCSKTCWQRATAFHKLRCRLNLKPYDTAKPSPLVSSEEVADDRLLLRILTTLVSGGAPHPLQGLVINALTASYDREEPERFSLARDIVRPLDMLTKLGVDIFACQEWDTWVILTILARIRNNSRESHVGDRHLIAVNPLYSFFNHSCDPNVTDVDDEDDTSSTLTMKTTRPVATGEELFISYLHEDDLALSRVDRNEKLRQWIGRDCQCTRCKEEMRDGVEISPRTSHLNRVFGQQRYQLLYIDRDGEDKDSQDVEVLLYR